MMRICPRLVLVSAASGYHNVFLQSLDTLSDHSQAVQLVKHGDAMDPPRPGSLIYLHEEPAVRGQ